MVSGKLLLLGTTLCLGACMGSEYPNIRPIPAQSSERSSPFDRAYQEGKQQLSGGYAGLAVVAFQRAIRLNPLSIAAMNGIGAAYDELKRYDIAQRYYRQALQLAPRSADTLNNIAVSLQLAGDPTAREWFERAAQADPANITITANLALSRSTEPGRNAVRTQQPEDVPAQPDDLPRRSPSQPSLEQMGLSQIRLNLPAVAPSDPVSSDGVAKTESMSPAVVIQPSAEAATPPAVPAQKPSQSAAQSASSDLSPVSVEANASVSSDRPAKMEGISAAVAMASQAEPNALLGDRARKPPQPAAKLAPSNPLPVSLAVAPPVPGKSPLIAIANCVGRSHMAKRFRTFFRERGLAVGRILNAPTFDCQRTIVMLHSGREPPPDLARLLPVPIETAVDDAVGDGIRVVLGRDLLPFDRTLGG